MDITIKTRKTEYPDIRISQNYKVSCILEKPVYTLPVFPERSDVGLVGGPLNECLQSLGLQFERYIPSYLQALAIILYGVRTLCSSRDQDPAGLYSLSLPRRAQNFVIRPRYKVNNFGHMVWCKLIDALESSQLLVKLGGGYKTEAHMQGLSSIYLPTEALVSWLQQVSSRLELQRLEANSELLLLSAKLGRQKVLIDYHDDETTQKFRRQLALINDVCRNSKFEVRDREGQACGLFPAPLIEYKRNFRDNFASGGRVHCMLQSLSKARRKELLINGSPTVELDYRSHQPRLLYHLHGLEAPTDCYDHPVLPRSLMKAATTRSMNCRSPAQAKRMLVELLRNLKDRGDLPEPLLGLSPAELLKSVFSSHPLLQRSMSDTLWKTLQHQESLIALGVMERLALEGYPCLGIHDSFVVAEEAGEYLHQLMVEEYQARLGFRPFITAA